MSLVVRDLVADYGAAPILRGITLEARPGAIVGVFGANGAGKSTLMRAIAGQHRNLRGVITVDGTDITHRRPHRVAREGIRLVPQGHEPLGPLTVEENLQMGAYLMPRARARVAIEELLERFGRLRQRRQVLASALSGGERAMLGLARALVSQPRVLLLDEPSVGLSPHAVREFFTLLVDARTEGTTLLVEQNVGEGTRIANYVYVLDQGTIVAQGDPDELTSNPDLARAYLGGGTQSDDDSGEDSA